MSDLDHVEFYASGGTLAEKLSRQLYAYYKAHEKRSHLELSLEESSEFR